MKTMFMPHPILLPDGTDYKDGCKFDMIVESQQRTMDENILVEIKFILESKFMRRLLEKGNAKFCLVVGCTRTLMRAVYETADLKMILRLPLADYADKITMMPYIVSTVPIKSFKSKEHHEEFNDVPISIPEGAILARGSDGELAVDSLQTLTAAIRLTTDDRVEKYRYVIDIDDDHINIKMHPDTRTQVGLLRNSDPKIMFPTLYMAAVTHALQHMQENSHRKWAQALKKTLDDRKMEMDEDLPTKAYRYAQQLLQSPLRHILERKMTDD